MAYQAYISNYCTSSEMLQLRRVQLDTLKVGKLVDKIKTINVSNIKLFSPMKTG